VSSVPGVGVARARSFARLGVVRVVDLLRLAPRRFEDRRAVTPTAELVSGVEATWIGRVVASRLVRAPRGLVIVEATLADDTGEVRARWFNQAWLARSVAPGAVLLLHGPVRASGGRMELVSPEVERAPDDPRAPHPSVRRFVPVHPRTTGLSAAGVRRAVWTALDVTGPLPDPIPRALLDDPGADLANLDPLPSLEAAVRALHFPAALSDAEDARRRLAFDELLVHELLLARRRAGRRREVGVPFTFTPTLDRRIRGRFPFPLTPAQDRAVAAIVDDLRRPSPMNRLLQGDVGAGKTLVAVYACLACVANGFQAAFMAPTEVLARQHEATLRRLLEGSEVRMETLYGIRRGKARKEAVARLADGGADLVIGTHAVLSKDVAFAKLGLVVVDEQHKFGVRQRRDLVVKGPSPHVLVMTATPIPRTLAMVVYGDLDVTVLDGLPPGRGARETWVVRAAEGERVLARVKSELAAGRQAFVVYPLVEESDTAGLRDATAGALAWRRALPGRRVGLVHGRQKPEERAAAVEGFRRGAIDVLVATVVIEVGVDVPNATVLVVEHAERFGLSQLHQLRGRVGRGRAGGLCVLVDRSKGGMPDRLAVLARTEDGFEIAEADLRLRGAGDLFGTRQHGAPGFVAARWPDDLPLLERARAVARRLVERDPGLAGATLRPLRQEILAREQAAGDPSRGG